ncbi:MAG: phosphate ABC transporter substrate-binding/OmpA family protein [Pseudomonadota bacterium]
MNPIGCLRMLAAACALPFACTAALALERVELIGGSTMVGTILERSDRLLSIQLNDGPVLEIPTDQIVNVEDIVNELRFAGSNTVGERLVPALAEAYARENGASQLRWKLGRDANEKGLEVGRNPANLPDLIDIRAHGSSTAYPALAEKSADIGMSSRPIKDDEASVLATLGDMRSADAEHIVALDGLAIIVHPDNPISTLSKQEIAEIFACQKTDWQDIGGDAGPIRIYARDAKSGTYDTFNTLVLKPLGLELCDATTRIESSSQLADSVARDPNAIGFIGLGYTLDAKPIAIEECAWGYSPSTFSVKTEEYPFARRLFLYAPLMTSSPWVRDFVDFALSDGSQAIIRDVDFVDLTIDTTEADSATYRLAKIEAAGRTAQQLSVVNELLGETADASRLSATFRFRPSISNLDEKDALDNRALRDLGRLARYLEQPIEDGAKLLLFGFADSSGDYGANLALSEKRAKAIADKLASLGIDASAVRGFGEEAPVACNDTPAGRAKNRRVEVWLRSPDTPLDRRLTKVPM